MFVGSLPKAKHVIVAIANKPQSTLPDCFATFITFTSIAASNKLCNNDECVIIAIKIT